MIEVKTSERKSSLWEDWLWQGTGPFQKEGLHKLMFGKALEQRLDWLNEQSWPTQKVQEFLKGENNFSYLSEQQKINLAAAERPETRYLLTGQQPGLLGGSILWFYKALTAVTLAKKHSTKENPVIPLFWIAGDDSDVVECNHFELLEMASHDSHFLLPHHNKKVLKPVGERELGRGCRELKQQLKTLLKNIPPDWWDEFLKDDLTFSQSFKLIAQKLLGETGLLFADGSSQGFKKLSNPILKEIAESAKVFQSHFNQVTEEIKSFKKPQIDYKEHVIHCFFMEKGVRKRMRYKGGQFYPADGSQQVLDLQKLSDEGCLTHDAVSRPIVLDKVFPVLGHVLGPSEMGYFTQLTEVFKKMTGHVPLVHPRLTATVIGREQFDGILKVASLESWLIMTSESLKRRLQEAPSEPLKLKSESLKNQLKLFLQGIKQREFTDEFDYFTRFEGRVLHEAERLEKKLNKVDYAKQAPSYQALFDVVQWLGNGKGQDRHLNIFSLINKVGHSGFKEWVKHLDPLSWEHLTLVLS